MNDFLYSFFDVIILLIITVIIIIIGRKRPAIASIMNTAIMAYLSWRSVIDGNINYYISLLSVIYFLNFFSFKIANNIKVKDGYIYIFVFYIIWLTMLLVLVFGATFIIEIFKSLFS
ncbi:MAG: hypothetical protein R3Y21_00060 [Mycoplasmatota bacterium]